MSEMKSIRVARVGYGPDSSIRQCHDDLIAGTERLEHTAVCDPSPEAREVARRDLGPDVVCYDDLAEMLEDDVADLCVIVTPHNTHASLACRCLEAGYHVVVEKPMCISYADAEKMVETADEVGKVLSVFHNRRWDGYFQAIKQTVIEEELLGDIFQIEGYRGGYKAPKEGWRDDQEVSGGAHYDWGAHAVDQALQLLPGRSFDTVYGIQHADRVWTDISREDHIQALLRFQTGEVVDMQFSQVAHVDRPIWRILGTEGTLVYDGGPTFSVHSRLGSHAAEAEIDCGGNDWGGFYRNLADHLLQGADLAVTPESAARVIAVLEYAGRSARSGKVLEMPCE